MKALRLSQCQIHLLLGKLSVVPSGASCASCAKWCHNWIVEKKLGSSESTIASAFNSWEELTLLCRLTRQGCFPTVSLSLCVCLDILRSSPRIVALIELYRWRHIPPPWMDWFFVGVAIDIFWPQIQGQSAGLSGTIFLVDTKVVSSEAALATLPTDGLPPEYKICPATKPLVFGENRILSLWDIVSSCWGSAGNALP